MQRIGVLIPRTKPALVVVIIAIFLTFLSVQTVGAEDCKDYFSGQWDTNWGEMTLQQTGCTVTGTYEREKGKIKGTVNKDGTILKGEWFEPPTYQPPDDRGILKFELAPGHSFFSGYWCYGDSNECGGWTGTPISEKGESGSSEGTQQSSSTASGQSTPPLGFVTYADETSGFSISYPRDWEQMPPEFIGEGVTVAFWLKESEDLRFFTVGTAELSSETRLDSFFAEAKKHLETVEGCTSISTEDTYIGGKPAIEYTYTFTDSGVTFMATQVFLMRGTTAWSITCVSESGSFGSLESTFDAITKSFQVSTGEAAPQVSPGRWIKMAWPALDSDTPISLRGVWGSSAGDVFAVGDNGTILHYDGSSWTVMDHPGPKWVLNDVWGAAGNDVYAVGDLGLILHYDGVSWSMMENNPFYDAWMPPDFLTISGTSRNNFFVGDDNGTVWQYHGGKWTELGGEGSGSRNCGLSRIVDMSITPGDDVFAVSDAPYAGYSSGACYYDGSKWVTMKDLSNYRFDAAWLSNSYNIWVSAEAADSNWFGTGEFSMFHFSGNDWSKVTVPPLEPGERVKSIWGSSYGNVFAAGDGGPLWQFDGTSWKKLDPPHEMYAVYDIWGSSGSDVFFVGTGPFILHYGN